MPHVKAPSYVQSPIPEGLREYTMDPAKAASITTIEEFYEVLLRDFDDAELRQLLIDIPEHLAEIDESQVVTLPAAEMNAMFFGGLVAAKGMGSISTQLILNSSRRGFVAKAAAVTAAASSLFFLGRRNVSAAGCYCYWGNFFNPCVYDDGPCGGNGHAGHQAWFKKYGWSFNCVHHCKTVYMGSLCCN